MERQLLGAAREIPGLDIAGNSGAGRRCTEKTGEGKTGFENSSPRELRGTVTF